MKMSQSLFSTDKTAIWNRLNGWMDKTEWFDLRTVDFDEAKRTLPQPKSDQEGNKEVDFLTNDLVHLMDYCNCYCERTFCRELA